MKRLTAPLVPRIVLAAALSAFGIGCEAGVGPGTGGDGSTSSGTTSSATASGGAGGGTSTSSSTGSSTTDCTNPLDQTGCSCINVGDTRPCYTAEPGTQGLGTCKGGVQTCEQMGEFPLWGACVGAVVPAEENCADQLDHNCNGKVACEDSICTGLPGCCTAGETRDCYDGPTGTAGVGVCHAGVQTCDLSGAWSPCMGQIKPGSEPGHCADSLDNDCNGKTDCAQFQCLFDAHCQVTCTANATQPCYSGPTGTENVGPCHGGTQTCAADGSSWGPCVGEVTPGSETAQCMNGADDNCNGLIDCNDPLCAPAPQCCTPGGGSVDGTLWANSPSTLYRLDPSTFALTTVGNFNVGDQMTDIALTPGGELYGISFTSLYHVDKATGAATYIADVPGSANNALTFLPNGNLIAADSNGDVKIINPTTGGASVVGNYGGGLGSSGDIVGVSGGTLYGTVVGDDLVILNPSSGAASAVGPTGQSQVWGLAFAGGKVIGLTTSGEILQINPQTGASTVAATVNAAFWGATQSPLVSINPCP